MPKTHTPTAQRIVFTNVEGRLAGRASVILTHIEEMAEGESLTAFLQRRAAQMVPPGCPWSIVDTDAIPADPDFRSARVFDHDGKSFGHDIEKAREIHRNNIREARAPLLAAEDVNFMRAIEAGQDTQAIVAEKQRLRDAPNDPRIDAATTVEELRAVQPL